jgi:hypothetical protein
VDATDGRGAAISVGLSRGPTTASADRFTLDAIAGGIKAQPNTRLEAQGYAKIDGRRCVWSRSTGPTWMTSKSDAKLRMTRVQYVIPLNDGRAIELRIAALPEQFDKLAPLMKQSAASFRLPPRK